MPDWKPEIRRRLANLKLEPTREAAIVEELAQDLADCYAELIASGATGVEAYQQTLAELSGSELLAQELRRGERPSNQEPIVLGINRRTNMIANLWQDLRFGLRMLRKSPSFTIVAALTLALGIGANTAIFSVVNGVLLRPLPFPEPEHLVTVWERYPALNIEQNDPAAANYADWKAQSQSFDSLAMFTWAKGVNLTGGDEPARILNVSVTANLFQALRVGPLFGRVFTAEEETLGRDQVALLGYNLWKSRFGGDPAVVGKTIALDAQNCTVVGVMPQSFVFPGGTGINPAVDLWRPLALSTKDWQERSWHDYQVIGRLKPGVSLDQARVEMDTLQTRIQKANPSTSAGTHCKLIELREQSVGGVRRALLVLFGAAAFVLLIACANVANLLLARAATRQREFAIRTALGAGRWPIMRQLLVESMLLALVGAGLGALLAVWGVPALAASAGGQIAESTPGWNEIGVDLNVLGFTLVVAVSTGVIFGLAPAFQAARPDAMAALKDGGRGLTAGARRNRLRSALVVAEIALASVLLIGAGLLLQSFLKLQSVPPGFNPARVLTFELGLPRARFEEQLARATLVERLCERLQAFPGVEAAGATHKLPLSGEGTNLGFEIEGRPPLKPGQFQAAEVTAVTPDYLKAMQITMRAGRPFDRRDTRGSPPVCLINEELAKRYFANENPIGKRLVRLLNPNTSWEIVGVYQDVRHKELAKQVGPGIFVSYAQRPVGFTVSLALRTTGDPLSLASAVSAAVCEVDKDLPITKLRTMESVVSNSIAQPRFRSLLLGLFGALAVALAAIGVYGVISFSVTQRTHEFGIRLALGAQTGDVLRLVAREGMLLVACGIGLGVVAALGLTRVIASLLFGVKPTDLMTYVAVVAVLGGVGLLACMIPARRATKVAPIEALRRD
jgi:putative ABC transport system permease protein